MLKHTTSPIVFGNANGARNGQNIKKMHDHAGTTPENALMHTRIPSSKSALHHAGSRIQEKGKKTAPETTAEKRMPRTISGGLAGAREGGAQISGLSVYPGGGAWRSPGSTSAGPSKLVRS